MRSPLALVLLVGLGGCSAGGVPWPDALAPVRIVAGVGRAGFSGDGGPARDAALYLPLDVTIGPDRLVYLIDWNNHRIRVVDARGNIETFAGSGELGDGPDGPALAAAFNHPTQIVFDGAGGLYLATWHNSRVKRIDLASGQLTTVAGTGRRSYGGDGGPALAADLDMPVSLALAPDGLLVLDQANQVIRRIDRDGLIHRRAGRCVVDPCAPGATPVACPGSDKLACSSTTSVCNHLCRADASGDGGDALLAGLAQPSGAAAEPGGRLAIDAAGAIIFSDPVGHRVRRIDPSGIVDTVAGSGVAGHLGDGGLATAASLNRPTDLALGEDGTLYIADTQNSCVRAVSPAGRIRTIVGACGTRGQAGATGPVEAVRLNRPCGIALDGDHLYVADTFNHRVLAFRLDALPEW